MYSAMALAEEITRLASRAKFHSIALLGRDPLGNVECLQAALAQANAALPVMVDCDGQRPEAVRELASHLSLVQVSTDGAAPATTLGRIHATLTAARESGLEHALVVSPAEHASDAQLLRLVEQVHAVSEQVAVVIHPDEPTGGGPVEPRWTELLAHAAELHGDVRLLRRLAPPSAGR